MIDLLSLLADDQKQHNPLIDLWKTAHEVLHTQPDLQHVKLESFDPTKNPSHSRLRQIPGDDRVFHRGAANAVQGFDSEVVGVYDDQGNANDGYNCARILLSRHSNETFEIALFNPIYFPSGYPLLFARGGFGWHPDLKRTTGDKLTLLDYCRYLVQIRASAPNIPLATLFGLVFLVQDVVAGWSISLSIFFFDWQKGIYCTEPGNKKCSNSLWTWTFKRKRTA